MDDGAQERAEVGDAAIRRSLRRIHLLMTLPEASGGGWSPPTGSNRYDSHNSDNDEADEKDPSLPSLWCAAYYDATRRANDCMMSTTRSYDRDSSMPPLEEVAPQLEQIAALIEPYARDADDSASSSTTTDNAMPSLEEGPPPLEWFAADVEHSARDADDSASSSTTTDSGMPSLEEVQPPCQQDAPLMSSVEALSFAAWMVATQEDGAGGDNVDAPSSREHIYDED